jgi:hypothetical protein
LIRCVTHRLAGISRRHYGQCGGKLAAGQTVFSDLIPLTPVTVVPAECVSASPMAIEGAGAANNVVRDLPVKILAR